MEKVLLYLYICDRGNPNWDHYLLLFESIDIPTIDIAPGHHNGLSFQMVLNVNTMKQGIQIVKNINDVLGIKTLSVINKIKFTPGDKIATKYTKELITTGRFFDEKVSNNIKGIFYPKKNK